MAETRTVPVDLVIFGGGAAGLWLLDEARRRGIQCRLLEAYQLGSGQTIASQGIIHGGLKYTLSGLLTPSAQAIADMPVTWRRCLAGEQEPDLSAVRLRGDYCHLWRSTSLTGLIAMVGARAGLRVAPRKIDEHERPAALAGVRGLVARLDEQVIEPESLLHTLANRNRDHIIRIDVDSGLEFDRDSSGCVQRVRLINPDTGAPLDLEPRHVALCAGAGNETLAEMLELPDARTQRRPLHMVFMRGALPTLNGHCVDGASTRATITTTADSAGRAVWQVGGQISEDGADMQRDELIAHADDEIRDILPAVDLDDVEWATCRVERAESATTSGLRPDDAVVKTHGNVLTAWPTKLALAPRLAELVLAEIASETDTDSRAPARQPNLARWPAPTVAIPPWEKNLQWSAADSVKRRLR